MIRLFTLLLILSQAFNAEAQTQAVRIYGTASEYAGMKIDLLVSNDPVTENDEVIVSLNILPDGSFDESVLINQTTHCFAIFDRWKAEMYLSPGQSYQLVFPPHQSLSESEKRNPFFRPTEIAFGLKELQDDDINRLIRQFEEAYNQEENQYFNQIFKDKSSTAADLMIGHLKNQFPESGNSYFEAYKFFRLAAIRFASRQNKTNEFIKTDLDRKPIDFNLPPYRQLFEQQFTNFFFQESSKIDGKKFRIWVGTANLISLETHLVKQKGWSAKLSRMVILKGINDAYYQGQFSPNAMLTLLDKIALSEWTAKEKSIAALLKKKLTYLIKGTQAPDIQMKDLNGNTLSLSAFKGKIVYLHFTSVTNPICRQHLDELKKIVPQIESKVEFIHVLPVVDLEKRTLILEQNWPGKFMVADDNALETYRVKTFPTAFLLDENQVFISSPSLNPMDGLSKEITEILKSKRMEELRNQAR